MSPKSREPYVANGATAPKRKLVGDLYLLISVRDDHGQQTPLSPATLAALGLAFDTSIDELVQRIPVLPVLEMGQIRSGQPVFGFRGKALTGDRKW